MKRLLTASAVGTLVLIASGTAWAVMPDSDGTIHGCVNQATGVLRVIDTDRPGNLGRCIASGPALLRETPLDWNQVGPPGPEGPRGEQGPAGPTGGGAVLYERLGGGINLDEQEYRLSMDLPAGAYLVTTTFQIDNDSPEQSFANQPLVTCQIGQALSAGPFDVVRQSVPSARGVSLVTAVSTFDIDEPWTLELSCPRVQRVTFMSEVALRAQALEQIVPA